MVENIEPMPDVVDGETLSAELLEQRLESGTLTVEITAGRWWGFTRAEVVHQRPVHGLPGNLARAKVYDGTPRQKDLLDRPNACPPRPRCHHCERLGDGLVSSFVGEPGGGRPFSCHPGEDLDCCVGVWPRHVAEDAEPDVTL